LRQWVKKLVDQLELDWGSTPSSHSNGKMEISEELATILFLIDAYNKNLFEIEHHPVRRTRDSLDAFAKGLVDPDREKVEKTLFRLRQFISSYRLDEYTYIQKTFEDFKNIIWDFADQLGEELHVERAQDMELKSHLIGLREAVEANSIQQLRAKSREFIDTYVENQTRKEERRTRRVESIQKNLHTVKKQLMEANMTARLDHLTGIHNRKSFDEQLRKYHSLAQLSENPVSLIILDIDHFKKVNDNYGHDVGDFVIKECVRLTHEIFCREIDFLARIGGEEFAIVLPDYQVEHCMKKAEELLAHIRKAVIIQSNMQIHFTISLGIAQLLPHENIETWVKRADSALYESKNSGRNRFTVATKDQKPVVNVA
jgi:diguanylate cyclase